jgi:diamine N-acetyltransferase
VTPVADVTLREVTRETLGAILKLRVAASQEKFVASNAVSLAQAHFYPETAWFRAIYAGEEPVGFVMLELDDTAGEFGLWRFMIDERHQGRGYGRKAIELAIDHVVTQTRATVLLTSIVPGEGNPGPFYRKLGFVHTGEVEHGEHVMRLDLRTERDQG